MKKRPTRLEIRLYDALENLLQDAETGECSNHGKRRAYNTLNEFNACYGCSRHNGRWNRDPLDTLRTIVGKISN
jgi:hypothetical protein